MNDPSPERVSTKPAAVTASTKVNKSGLPVAISTIDSSPGEGVFGMLIVGDELVSGVEIIIDGLYVGHGPLRKEVQMK